MVTLSTWRDRMSEDMRLRDFRPRTQEAYLATARQFVDWVGKEPVDVAEDDVRRYFLFLRETKQLAPSSINLAVHALRFFLTHTLQRDWAVLELLRVNKPRTLPVVLSTGETRALLGAVRHPVRRVALTTIYALGLRLNEGLALETGQIDADRLLVWVRDGKGGVDRGVPLPRPLLSRLRRYWKEERPACPTPHLFIAEGREAPMHETTLQKTFKAARLDAGLAKDASIHTLRHSYATHLLEAGVTLRTIQQVLGHKSLRTTEGYMHVTQPGTERLQETLDHLMAGLGAGRIAMLLLADIVRRHGPAYRERFGAAVLPSHLRALDDIVRCRTPALGGHLAICSHCDEEHILFHSCRNRACPRCGHDTTVRWLERQRQLLLPVPYFHVVFTLPEELHRLIRSHQRALVGALFRAAFDAVAALARDDHFLGAHIGALAVLHTWTRTLAWHPHVHMLVPAGGLAPDGRTWRPLPRRKRRFLAPVHALAKLFRGRFLALALARRALRATAAGAPFPTIPWEKRWVVFAKPVAHGADKVLDYLGRYVHRTAMSDRALLAMDERTVTFRYRDSRDHRHKVLTLPADEMLRRLLQHVPPKGMHRVRAFELLHPAERDTLRRLQLLLAPRPSGDVAPIDDSPPPRVRTRCAHCGTPGLALIRRIEPDLVVGNEIAAAGVWQRARAPPSVDATAP